MNVRSMGSSGSTIFHLLDCSKLEYLDAPTKLNQAVFAMIFVIIAFSTLLYGAVHQGVLAIVYAFISLGAVLWAVEGLRSGSFAFSSEPIQLILYGAAAYGFIQALPLGTFEPIAGVEGLTDTLSLDPHATQVSALHFVALGLFFSWLSVSLNSASRLRKIAVFITVFGAIYAFYAILQSLLSPAKIYGLLERPLPFGSFVSRNNFAGWMEMAIALPLGMIFSGAVPRDKRLIYLTAATLMGISILLSGSRGGLVALVIQIAFLLFLTYSQRDRSSIGLKILLGSGIIVAIVAGTAFVGGENTLTRISTEETAAEGIVTRPYMWSVTWKMIEASMPFGVGLGAYGVAYTKYDEASGFERVEQAHNDYLQVLSDAGLVGGLLGIAFLVLLWRIASKAIRTSNPERRGIAMGALAGIISILIHSIFDFVLHTTAIALLFLTLVGLLVAASSRYSDDDPRLNDQARTRRKTPA